MSARLLALCTGAPSPLPDGKLSAIDKQERAGPIRIGRLGLDGDAQVDRKHHGGEHMAVHHYPADHYGYWRTELPAVARLGAPGAFGENLHVSGLTESDVLIGDRFRVGSALLEVSMGRQPCSTLARHFEQTDMVKRIVANGRCGWYYRVLEEGEAEAGDIFERVESGAPEWTVERAFALLFEPKRVPDRAEIEEFISLPALGPVWRKKAEAKIA
ncbi:MOSC domain-containing protein [Qipengyuania soli]|uniref:MOSC domain-containing protein n=1 Tax=Qipengyuania soli TaxID=2782568 RepID=A0A7S8F222_9SPHN|nr:MOSC domain-containing protein [Qipengyuania soli]QPC97754.1 MOSC domain-containing protein [Qipengyuania soli]